MEKIVHRATSLATDSNSSKNEGLFCAVWRDEVGAWDWNKFLDAVDTKKSSKSLSGSSNSKSSPTDAEAAFKAIEASHARTGKDAAIGFIPDVGSILLFLSSAMAVLFLLALLLSIRPKNKSSRANSVFTQDDRINYGSTGGRSEEGYEYGYSSSGSSDSSSSSSGSTTTTTR
ncbi:hypothetical protein RRG08_030745 [Elysia crispata]|uniref:Uncharacterized protein n=1 Tax=Elysia crispata TaxID=231223 RepID=A0AAE1E1V0_9GAST|nr:hypothetical protein RRG08_030745 [Elysia crispata]